MMVTDTFKKKSAALAIVLALALIGAWGLLPSKADAETANSGETLQSAAASLSGVDVPGFCTKGNSANLSVSNLRMAQSIAKLENPTTKLASSARALTDRELSNIRLVIPSGGFVYDGTPKMPTVTGLPSGVTASDYEMTYENNIKAGTNTAVARITFSDGVVSGEKEFTFSIAKAKITVSGITAKDKEYDASKTATLNYDNVVLDGKVANDILFVTAKGVFSDSSTGQDKVVKISNIRLFGPSSSNYVLASTGQQTSTTASITLEELEGISIKLPSTEYVYDGTAKEPAVLGLDGNANYTIKYENNVKAGENTAKVVVTLNKDGAKLPKVFYFSIAQAKVTVSGITAKSKNYDGTTKATLNLKDAEVAGKVAKDTVSVTATGEFDSAEEGTGKTVFISDIALTGRDASNYYLAESGNQTTTTADILPKEVKLHTITLNPNGGTVTPTSVQYDEYTGLLTLPTPSRPGYTFAGWHRGVTRYDSIPGDSYFYYDFTLTAKWTANSYTVTFDPNGGTVSTTSKTYTTDKGLSSLPNPTRTGYTFDGWYVGNTLYKKIPAGTYGDMTLKAEWTENSYQIEYALNGGKGTKPSTQTVKYTQEVKLATGDGFSRDGYTFAGWSYNNKTYAGGSVASKLSTGNEAGTTEIVMKAVWKANEYTLTLDPNGGTVENSTKPITKKFTTDSGLSSLPNPERAGYTFDGWYNGSIRYTKIIAGTISDITLTAKWTPITYTVTFKPNGGTASATTMKYTTDKGLSTLATATRTGYTFNGWYLNNKEYKKIEAGTIGNLTLTAGWTENSYTIKYNLNGGTGTTPSAQTVKYTANAKLATNTGFSKAGYEFAGWNFGSKTYAANAQVSKLSTGNSTGTTEITMTATWKVVSYSITYNGNGGTVGSTSGKTSYTIENGLASLPDASRNGYDFDGWYAGNTKYTSIPKGTYGNLTLTAKWTSKEYTVTYNADGGSVTPSSQKYKTDTGLSSLPNATKTGYTFSGWYNGNTKYTSIAKGTYGNLTLTAKWSANTYTVTYDANGGSVSPKSQTFTYGSGLSSLPNATKTNYVFDGWYSGNTKYNNIPSTYAGNITLKAQWKEPTAPAITVLGSKNPNGSVYIDNFNVGAVTDYEGHLQQQSNNKVNYKWNPNKTLPAVTANDNYATKYVTGFQVYKNGSLDKTVTYNGLYDYVFVAGNTYELRATLATGKYNVIMMGISENASTDAVQGVVTANGKATYVASFKFNSRTDRAFWYGNNYKASRTGYTFGGWYANGEVQAGNGCTWLGISMIAYAIWDNTVTYDANGGSVSTKSQTYKEGTGISSLPTPTRAGYTFDGWYNGNTKYTSIPAGTGNITLTARWTANTGTVTYYSNYSGGAASQSNTYTYNSSYTVKGTNTFTRNGYNLLGWSTSSTASYTDDSWIAGKTFSNFTLRTSGNVSLYAVWHCNQYKLTFDANGGSCSEKYRWYTINDQVTNFPTPTRSGYSFAGWYENNNQVTQYNKGTTGDRTLTAKWNVAKPTVTVYGWNSKGGQCYVDGNSVGAITGYESRLTKSGSSYKWNPKKGLPVWQAKSELNGNYVSGVRVYKDGVYQKTIGLNNIYDLTFTGTSNYELHPVVATDSRKLNIYVFGYSKSAGPESEEGTVTKNGKATYTELVNKTTLGNSGYYGGIVKLSNYSSKRSSTGKTQSKWDMSGECSNTSSWTVYNAARIYPIW